MIKPLTQEQQKLIEEIIPYLDRLAKRYAWTKQESDDFRSAAYLAACEAIHSWDSEKGESLKTWVTRRVPEQFMRDRQFSNVPITIPREENKVTALAWKSSVTDLSELMNITQNRYPGITLDKIECSLWLASNRWNGRGNTGFRRVAYSEKHASKAAVEESTTIELRDLLINWVKQLDERDGDIIKKYFFQGLTLREIGRIYGLSPEGVRLRISSGLEQLKEIVTGQGDQITTGG